MGAPQIDDSVLLNRFVKERTDDAMHALMDRHAALVYGVCKRRVGQREMAEDATQAVFLILCRRAAHLTRHASLAGWLYTCADSVSRDALRREARRMKYEETAFKTRDANQVLTEGLGPDLEDAMRKLGANDREALILRFLEGYSLAELGQTLKISDDAARMRVQRALERLRDELSKLGVTASVSVIGEALPKTIQPTPPSLLKALHRVDFARSAPLAVQHLTKGAPHFMTPLAGLATLSAVTFLALGGAASIRFVHSNPVSQAAAITQSTLPLTRAAQPQPATAEAQKAISSMIQAFVGDWAMTFKANGFGQKETIDRSPKATVTFDAPKNLLSIKAPETAASTTIPNYDWPIDVEAGTIKMGASDDPAVDTSLQFVSSRVKGETSTLLFSRQSPHLANKLTVTYSKTRFSFQMDSQVFHEGKWLKGQASWTFERTR